MIGMKRILYSQKMLSTKNTMRVAAGNAGGVLEYENSSCLNSIKLLKNLLSFQFQLKK
ncbi:MAG: hypothetical protein ACJAYJ_003501 [Saprospiraceae bacterium]|jgi:hypothetical protein